MFGQLRTLVVIPALQVLGLDGAAARNLVLGTAAQESGGRCIAQIGGGPALSMWELEPATIAWVCATIASRYPVLYARLRSLAAPALALNEQVASSLLLGAALCRLRYYLVEEALPPASDVAALGRYWKTHYNTPGGAGTAAEFVANFSALIGALPDLVVAPAIAAA